MTHFRLLIGIFIYSHLLLSNTFVSSGGERISDRVNPWFLFNASEVTYCLIVSGAFEVTESAIDQSIQMAWAFWQKEMNVRAKFETLDGQKKRPLRVKSQKITKEPCTGEQDIEFHLGHRLLPGSNKNYFARNARLEYDTRLLKGKGVIFVAPNRGIQRPQFPGNHPNPWRIYQGGVLTLTLIHEFGNIFGISDQHVEPNLFNALSMRNVMRSDFVHDVIDFYSKMHLEGRNPNQAIPIENYFFFKSQLSDNVLKTDDSIVTYTIPSELDYKNWLESRESAEEVANSLLSFFKQKSKLGTFFGIDQTQLNNGLTVNIRYADRFTYNVSICEKDKKKCQLLGHIFFDAKKNATNKYRQALYTKFENTISIFLPDEQLLFSSSEKVLRFARRVNVHYFAKYISADKSIVSRLLIDESSNLKVQFVDVDSTTPGPLFPEGDWHRERNASQTLPF